MTCVLGLPELVSCNPFIEGLEKQGYLIDFVNGFFVIYGLPYLNNVGALEHGDWVSQVDLTEDGVLNPPKSDQASFRGGRPHDGKGRELRLGTAVAATHVAEGFDTAIMFSYKLKDGDVMRDYRSFEEKVLTYLDTITGPAMAAYPKRRLCGLSRKKLSSRAVPFAFPTLCRPNTI